MKYMHLLLFLVLIPQVLSDIIISEIMFNPIGSDNNHEWIEVYADSEINLSNLNFYENDVFHNLHLYQGKDIIGNAYAIIADDPATLLNDYPSIYVTVYDSSFSLSNSGELIRLVNSSCVLYETFYNTSPVQDGNTLSYINESWYETTPTPGYPNQIISIKKEVNDLELLLNIEENLFTNIEYESLFKIKNLNYETGIDKINVTFYYNLTQDESLVKDDFLQPSLKQYTTQKTGTLFFNDIGAYILCGVILSSTMEEDNFDNNALCITLYVTDSNEIQCNISLSIDINKIIFDEGEKLEFYNDLSDTTYPFEIQYWITDINDEIVKSKITTKNTNKKSYTPSFNQPEKAFIIKSGLSWIACNNSLNAYDEKLVVFRNSEFVAESSSNKESTIDIISIPTNGKFGQTIKVKLDISKGNTQKNALKAYIKDKTTVSEITSMNIYGKNQNYDLTIPIRLKSDCKYKTGTYDLVVEGLDVQVTEKIQIQGNECEEIQTSESKSTPLRQYVLLSFSENITEESVAVLQINNQDNKSYEYTAWSYVYKGGNSYSGDRESNKQILTLKKDASETIILKNHLYNMTEGNYKLKIKILRNDRTTPYEFTKDIFVTAMATEKQEVNKSSNLNLDENNPSILTNEVLPTGKVVYKSSSEKMKGYSVYFVLLAVLLTGVALYKLRN